MHASEAGRQTCEPCEANEAETKTREACESEMRGIENTHKSVIQGFTNYSM